MRGNTPSHTMRPRQILVEAEMDERLDEVARLRVADRDRVLDAPATGLGVPAASARRGGRTTRCRASRPGRCRARADPSPCRPARRAAPDRSRPSDRCARDRACPGTARCGNRQTPSRRAARPRRRVFTPVVALRCVTWSASRPAARGRPADRPAGRLPIELRRIGSGGRAGGTLRNARAPGR